MYKFIVTLESYNEERSRRITVMADSADEAMAMYMFGEWMAVEAVRANLSTN